MPQIPQSESPVIPHVVLAALMLVATAWLKKHGLPSPSATEVLGRLGVARSQAYEVRSRLLVHLSTLTKPRGRPPAEQKTPHSSETEETTKKVLEFIMNHSGVVSGTPERRSYGRPFRLFIADLYQDSSLSLEVFAQAAHVPLGSLKQWLYGGQRDELPALLGEPESPAEMDSLLGTKMATVINEYGHWEGGFVAFCEHVQRDLEVPWGIAFIRQLLVGSGVRKQARRPGRSPDEEALRRAFETFFPNAQWVGDGSEVKITINDICYTFNLELLVDPYSGAFVGADIRNNEDAQAVTASFDDATETTGQAPLAVLLDNKPSNHCEDVTNHLLPALLMASTSFRPENKAHIEGGFGLFKQDVPDLTISGNTQQELAQSILRLVFTVWGRTVNHRPRRDRNNQSRIEIHQEVPTDEERAIALQRLRKTRARIRQARQNAAARQSPAVRAFVTQALDGLNLEDPDGCWLTAISRYPLTAITNGVASYEGKRKADTLPPGVDARYLMGIVRNISQDDEAAAIADALFEQRRRAGDLLIKAYQAKRDAILIDEPDSEAISTFITMASSAPWLPERHFWLNAIADVIRSTSQPGESDQFKRAARHIQAHYEIPARQRLAAIRYLASVLQPLP